MVHIFFSTLYPSPLTVTISNSGYFSKRSRNLGGEIEVRLYNTGTSIKAKIIDKGIGMDDRTMERIFEKFYQGDRAHASEGNGLGLSLVKRIVELSDGKVYVKSQKGKGTTFTVEL